MKNKIKAAARGGEGCRSLRADLWDSPSEKMVLGEKKSIREVSEGAAGSWGGTGWEKRSGARVFYLNLLSTAAAWTRAGLEKLTYAQESGKRRRSLCDRARGFDGQWASEPASNREWAHVNPEPVFPSQGQNPRSTAATLSLTSRRLTSGLRSHGGRP